MLTSSGLPKGLWGEAAITATYIYNRTPNSALEGYISPYEARNGEKPDISHLRTFGSICYKKEPIQSLKKLDIRANPYILIGFISKNLYKLIKPGGRTIISARDVDFIEGAFIKDILVRLEAKLAKIKT